MAYGDKTGVILVSHPIEARGTRQFMVPLLEGPVNLYSGSHKDGGTRFYIQPHDSAFVVEVAPATPRLAYIRVLSDCPSLDFTQSNIELRYRYSPLGVTTLVQEYNKCRYPQQSSKPISYPRGNYFQVGIKAGLHTTRFEFSDIGPSQKQQEFLLSYHAGLFFLFSSKRHLAMQLETVYMATAGGYGPVDVFNGYAPYTTTRTYSLRYSQLQVPLLLRYTGYGTGIRPYVNVGPLFSMNFNHRSEDILQNSNRTTPSKTPLKTPDGGSLGAAAGVGVLIKRSSLPELSVEARIDRMIEYRQTAIRLDVGVVF
ncbi:hypothetical protein GCM10027348_19060 [Hymenobacter tenuis]